MIQLTEGAGEVVAGDLRSALAAYDSALLTSSRMNVSVIEAMMEAGVPVGQSQRLLDSIVSSMSSVIEGRSGLVEATRHMLTIKEGSTLVSYDFGCPTGLDDAVQPEAAHPQAAAVA